MEQISTGKPFAERVHVKLTKRWEKATEMDVIPYTHGEGKYEVTGPNEYVPVVQTQDETMSIIHRRFQYIVTFGPERAVECTCRGIQLTGITCTHVLAVCRHNNWSPDLFVAHWYKVDYLLSTWNALFVPYGNPEDWPTTTTPKIEPNKDWIRRGRRKHIRQVMTMDEMQGRRIGHRPRRSTSDRQSRDAHNAANAAENERVMAEASGSQGPRRSTARSRTANRESANMMFREAMGEVLAGGTVGMQGPSGTTQRRRSTYQAGRRSTSHAGPSGTAHQQEEAVQPGRRSTSQAGTSGTAHQQEEAVQPARRSTSSWGSGRFLGIPFMPSRRQ